MTSYKMTPSQEEQEAQNKRASGPLVPNGNGQNGNGAQVFQGPPQGNGQGPQPVPQSLQARRPTASLPLKGSPKPPGSGLLSRHTAAPQAALPTPGVMPQVPNRAAVQAPAQVAVQASPAASPLPGQMVQAPPLPTTTPGGSPPMQIPAPAMRPPASPTGDRPGSEQQLPEIEGGSIILYRNPNFIVRTTNRQGRRTHPLRRPTGNTTMIPKVMPQQETRVASSDTRMMPQIEPINPINKKKQFPLPTWIEALVVVVGMVLTLVSHAINMFNYPHYELDEGTYMSSAWAILHGLITPYAYGYGHPPLAWMQIAAWVQLTGGFFTFGNSINSGRVLMLFYATGCSLLIYFIVRRLGGSRSTGFLAMVIFALSPISIAFQRQVFLDNVGTFWLLLAMCLLVNSNSRLKYIVGAALCFGIAILSKEIFALFLPVMIYATWLHTTKFQRKFALVAFAYATIAISSTFVLLAILKGELFPFAWHLPGDNHQHLSLLDTFIQQTQRSQSQGSLGNSWYAWTHSDYLLVICSIATIGFNTVYGWWNRRHLMVALFSASFWLLLIRGGVVFAFYIIPLIPLAAINTAIAVNTIMNWMGKLVRIDLIRAVLVLGAVAAIVPYDLARTNLDFTDNSSAAQTQAIVWVRQHVPSTAFIVINSWLYTDLHESGGLGVGDATTYPLAHVYYNVATDPEVFDKILNGNWDRIDYIVADGAMLGDIYNIGGNFNVIKTAIAHSVQRATFVSGKDSGLVEIKIYEVQHHVQQPQVMAPTDASHQATTAKSPEPLAWVREPRFGASHLNNEGG